MTVLWLVTVSACDPIADRAHEDLSFEPCNRAGSHLPNGGRMGNESSLRDTMLSSAQRQQIGHSSGETLIDRSAQEGLPNQPVPIPPSSDRSKPKPCRRPVARPQVVFEQGQMKVKTGGNQEPIGLNQRVSERSTSDPKPVDTQDSSHMPESPLADAAYIHPSRIERLEDRHHRSPSEDGEISDPLPTMAQAAQVRPETPEQGAKFSENSDWLHNRYEDDSSLGGAQKRPKALGNETIAFKKPRLSATESNLGDQANRLAAKELAMRMRLRARHLPESSLNMTGAEKIREIGRQRTELHNQIAREQSSDGLSSQIATDQSKIDKRRSSSSSPGKKADLRVSRESLPQASPLANVGRLAKIQEDIVQTKVQCAMAGKELKQEQKTLGEPSNATVRKQKEKDHVLQDLINKRDVIKSDQEKLEAFNKGVQVTAFKKEEDVQMPVIKREDRENSLSSEMQDVPPFIKQENVDPTLPQAKNPDPEPPRRSVRFNLTDVETLIESVKRSR